jgi:hypothetical protein
MSTTQSRAAEASRHSPPAASPRARGLLQRKCACGGASGPSGECEECRKKRVAGQQRGFLGLQTKLAIGASNDPLEQEADRVADQVLAESARPDASSAPPRIQRFTGQATAQADTAPASVDQVLASPGRPLEHALQQDMERRFGHDFSIVRIHTGAQAHDSARALHALAYTVGNDVVFGTGQYAPDTRAGRSLIAHELTHVIQQGGGGEPRHAQRIVQRQPDPAAGKEEEHEENFGIQGPPQPAPAELPGFGDMAPDAGCPPLPTNLGRLAPEPPCPTADADIIGERFTFCRASDVFSPGSERPRLITWARSQPATSTFVVHGYASESDGTPEQNVNVSCHRAKRVARELYNAGVRSERIEIAARGGTTRFGTGAGKLRLNRVAVVRADAPAVRATPTTLPSKPREIVDLAVEKLTRSEYRLAADAYVARWTCGRVPSLAEAVRRSVIRIEGEQLTKEFHPGDPFRRPEARLGFPIRAGRNEIVLARETFDDTTDPLSCVMARIVDLVFHHTVSDLIPDFNQQHAAAAFLIELAGLPPCRSPDAQMPPRPAFDWWKRPTADPRQGLVPNCGTFAEGPLIGAVTPQPATAASLAPAPTFTVANFWFEGRNGGTIASVGELADVDPNDNLATARPDQGPAFSAAARVVAVGSRGQVARYRVGFVQTIVSARVVVRYVGGQMVRFEIPVPIRDGPSRDDAAPPWLDPDAAPTFDTPGVPVVARFAQTPPMSFPFHFMDPAMRGRMKNDPKDPTKSTAVPEDEMEVGNVVNRAHKAVIYHTWLVVRRDDAPLDRFSTRVLDARWTAWTQNVDFVGRRGTGTFQANVDPTPLTDASAMQLGGPTPREAQFQTPRDLMRSQRIVTVAEATPRAQAGGMSIEQAWTHLRGIIHELEPLRRALGLREALTVRIRIDPATGRVARPGARHPAVEVHFAKEAELDEIKAVEAIVYPLAFTRLAEEILFRVRKDLVLGATGTAGTVKEWFAGPPVPELPKLGARERPEWNETSRPPGEKTPRLPSTGVVGAIREAQLDEESRKRRADNPGVFDTEFRVPVTVTPHSEQYLYDFSHSLDEMRTICHDKPGEGDSESCVVPRQLNYIHFFEKFGARVQTASEQLGTEVVASPIAVDVTSFPIRPTLYVPADRVAYWGRDKQGTTEDTLTHELHHLIIDFHFLQSFKHGLASAIRARVMDVRRKAATFPALRSALLAKGTIEAIVAQEYRDYVEDFYNASAAANAPLDTGDRSLPELSEAEIRRMWPAFRMPARKPGTKGSFTP